MTSFLLSFRHSITPSRSTAARSLSHSYTITRKQTTFNSPRWRLNSRAYSTGDAEHVEAPEYLTEGERKVFDIIKDGLQPSKLEVQDTSGGCGSMYALDIVSEQFRGLPVIKQHRLVNSVLGEEIKKWHGVQLKTRVP